MSEDVGQISSASSPSQSMEIRKLGKVMYPKCKAVVVEFFELLVQNYDTLTLTSYKKAHLF